jgi:hypothetical protein
LSDDFVTRPRVLSWTISQLIFGDDNFFVGFGCSIIGGPAKFDLLGSCPTKKHETRTPGSVRIQIFENQKSKILSSFFFMNGRPMHFDKKPELTSSIKNKTTPPAKKQHKHNPPPK